MVFMAGFTVWRGWTRSPANQIRVSFVHSFSHSKQKLKKIWTRFPIGIVTLIVLRAAKRACFDS